MSTKTTTGTSSGKPKRKGTANTETIIGAAATKLSAAVKSANEAIAKVTEIEQTIADNTLMITDQEMRIDELKTQFVQEKEKMQFDLQMEFQREERGYVDNYLRTHGMTTVEQGKLDELTDELARLKASYDNDLAAAVKSAEDRGRKEYMAQLQLDKATRDAADAETKATIKQQALHIAELNKQIDMWREQLTAERNASTERAKASAVGAIHVGDSSRK